VVRSGRIAVKRADTEDSAERGQDSAGWALQIPAGPGDQVAAADGERVMSSISMARLGADSYASVAPGTRVVFG